MLCLIVFYPDRKDYSTAQKPYKWELELLQFFSYIWISVIRFANMFFLLKQQTVSGMDAVCCYSVFILLPRSGLAGCKDHVELFCGGCGGGLDCVGVDSGCRGWVGVTEAGGDGGDRDAGVDHQGRVRMPQAVDSDVR